MRRLSVGLLAHVDAGKTTLSEAMLYRGGRLRRPGRVDHQNAFLDTDALERERGITIFSKMALLPLDGAELTLLDTPGHVDFSAEMERTLQVLDCAVLVISGTDGVQGHTLTLWRLLARYGIPTFLFVNKMDLAGADRAALMASLCAELDGGCVDFGAPTCMENVALCGEAALGCFLESGTVPDGEIAALVAARRLFPCFFGSALKIEGVDELLDALVRYTRAPDYPAEFGAKVFKITRDAQGARLTWLKVTGGSLRVKTLLSGTDAAGQRWEEKVDQIRLYSGEKFRPLEAAEAGTVCAVTGLSRSRAGEGLGGEKSSDKPLLEPVLSCRMLLPEGCDVHSALQKLGQLEEEDPQLHIVWNEQLREIHMQMMGEVQLEILERKIRERFGLEVRFGPGSIVYRETIAAPVIGVGHFEPLRHYAEVHLLLEPGERGSGLQFGTLCSEDVLDRNWQRLILTHLMEKTHLGVLTGSPITDMRITLLTGRAHEKHTEGGDFRQATWRAVRQGLMCAKSVLLEPWYRFRLELPTAQTGRALADLQRMNAELAAPEALTGAREGTTLLTGSAPVAALRGYATELASYTHGLGRLLCTPGGYAPCREQEAVVAAIGYDCERDVDNPADSVFCSHGAGHIVPWNLAPAHMHLQSSLPQEAREEEAAAPAVRAPSLSPAQDSELAAIFERTYGPVRRREIFARERQPLPPPETAEKREIRPREEGTEYLLVDGYNIIYAWDELKAVAAENLDAARAELMDILCDYQAQRQCTLILVFDAYKVRGGVGEVSRYHNIYVVYTREAETADAYIERVTYELGKKHHVRVATSDGPEQLIILGHGALRLSARVFRAEVEQTQGRIAEILRRLGQRERSRPVQKAIEKAKRREGK